MTAHSPDKPSSERGSSPKRDSRRNFLSRVLVAWSGMFVLPAAFVIVKYLIPPKLRDRVLTTLKIGKISDVAVNDAKIVRFNKTPVAIVKNTEGQIKAFSTVCTHLGCIVEFRTADRKFHCNCHGSTFDYDGTNISGPAPRPLQPFRVEIDRDELTISGA